ncbi:hypothetical protein HPB49_000925 [Dermacentor silvarum]|uniref:Uncharacterized protein n=1 Tax=Dermacentor silvarum TaxID=543639 RepID=A0ACB8CU77_DERSI|nr:hypothetical protein HPB49_000925 [Dermacentor silvarum]
MRPLLTWRRFVAPLASARTAEKVLLAIVTTLLLWTTAIVYAICQIAQGRQEPLLWPPVPSRLREARQLLVPFRPFLDDHAAQRQRSQSPGRAVAEQCRWPLDVLFLVHTTPGRRERRAFLRSTLFEYRLVRYFNWTAVFFTHDRTKDSFEAVRLGSEVAQEGDLVDISPYAANWDAERSKRRRSVLDAQMTLEALRWAFRHCHRVRHVVEMPDGVVPRYPFMFVRYLRDYVDPARRILACRLSRTRRRNVFGNASSGSRKRWAGHTKPSLPEVVRYCAGSPVTDQTPKAVRVLTGPALRGLYVESLVPGRRLVDKVYVTGDLALAAVVRHVDFAEAGESYLLRNGRTINYTAMFATMPRNMTAFRHQWWASLRRNSRVYEPAFRDALRITLPAANL